jgi:hypothetical protein
MDAGFTIDAGFEQHHIKRVTVSRIRDGLLNRKPGDGKSCFDSLDGFLTQSIENFMNKSDEERKRFDPIMNNFFQQNPNFHFIYDKSEFFYKQIFLFTFNDLFRSIINGTTFKQKIEDIGFLFSINEQISKIQDIYKDVQRDIEEKKEKVLEEIEAGIKDYYKSKEDLLTWLKLTPDNSFDNIEEAINFSKKLYESFTQYQFYYSLYDDLKDLINNKNNVKLGQVGYYPAELHVNRLQEQISLTIVALIAQKQYDELLANYNTSIETNNPITIIEAFSQLNWIKGAIKQMNFDREQLLEDKAWGKFFDTYETLQTKLSKDRDFGYDEFSYLLQLFKLPEADLNKKKPLILLFGIKCVK